MTTSEILDIFYSRTFEQEIQENLLDDLEYPIPISAIRTYVDQIIAIPYAEFIQYGSIQKVKKFSTREITQCSSIESCTEKMCYILYDEENRGKTFEEIGQSSMFDGIVRSDKKTAKIKYGENQTKTAEQLGLAFQYFDRWYLSCLGYVFPDLPPTDQQKLLSRTILRNDLYYDILKKIRTSNINLSEYLQDLSISTQGRRAKSIIQLLTICLSECTRNSIKYYNIYYPTYIAKSKSLTELVIKGTIFNTDND